MHFDIDKRPVMILDAGGTNFVFSAMSGGQEITEKITLPSFAADLDKCLGSLVSGFRRVLSLLSEPPVAISFAFPGPADYPRGIISADLPNFPAFRGREGFPLADYLQEQFKIPAFLNNDGDLFAYGEAMFGLLPAVNRKLKEAGSQKEYHNLLGITLGTGFGAGVVLSGQLLVGDNACGAEIYSSRDYLLPKCFAEESVSIRGIKRMYAEHAKDKRELSPKDIFQIAEGKAEGNPAAARKAFELFGMAVGDAVANIIAMIDGLVVIGGGLTGAANHFLPAMMAQLNGTIQRVDGSTISRIPQKAYNLEKEAEFRQLAAGNRFTLKIPGTDKTVSYDKERRIGVGLSHIGTSNAIMQGAYAYALAKLEK